MNENVTIVKEYLAHVEKFSADAEAFQKLVHPQVSFIEHPNPITKNGQVRNLSAALEGLETGKKILAWQKYEITNIVDDSTSLVVEAKWTGQVAVDVGHLKKDQVLTAYAAMRFDFKDGKIFRQVNYDCYEPF